MDDPLKAINSLADVQYTCPSYNHLALVVSMTHVKG